MKLIPSLSKAFFDSDLVHTRIILSLGEFLWAVMLLWPGDTFGRPTYDVMSRVMSEASWGFVFLVSSILQFSIVVYEQQNRDWAKVFANWNAVLWVFVVGASVVSVYPPPAAMGGEVALAFAAFWVWIRALILDRAAVKLNVDRRESDRGEFVCRYEVPKDIMEVSGASPKSSTK